jgi:hypothetical protein
MASKLAKAPATAPLFRFIGASRESFFVGDDISPMVRKLQALPKAQL